MPKVRFRSLYLACLALSLTAGCGPAGDMSCNGPGASALDRAARIGEGAAPQAADDDGDSSAEVTSEEPEMSRATAILGRQVEGESTVDVYLDRTGTFQLRSSLDNTVLTAFGTVADEQTLTTTRALQRDERIELWDTLASEMLDCVAVLSADRVIVWGLELSSALKDGASFLVTGLNLNSNLSVDLRLSRGTGSTWTACPVTQVLAGTMTVRLPDLSLSRVTEHVIRVKDDSGKELYYRRHRIWPRS